MFEEQNYQADIQINGYTIICEIYNDVEIERILSVIGEADKNRETFRKSVDLFAVRQFFKEIPDTIPIIFNDRLKAIINEVLNKNYLW